MTRSILPLVSVIALSTLGGNGCTDQEKLPPPADVSALVKGNNEFAFRLYQKLAEKDGNVFFSPYSISAVLTMTYGGARGDTADEMAKVLGIAGLGDRAHPAHAELANRLKIAGGKDRPEFHVANALWGQRGLSFRPEFLDLTRRHYGGGFRELDFAGDTDGSRKTINDWVGEQTRDKIPELLKPGVLSSNTKLVLTNAIYFKGDWAHPFDPKTTREGDFFRSPTDKVKVPLMTRTADLRYAEVGDARVLELPYAGGEFSMVVVLPKRPEDMGRVEAALADGALDAWLANAVEREVIMTLPRFRLRISANLIPRLQQLGMVKAFAEADFSGLTGSRDLRITAVVHEAFMDVDEKGTEAAAATAVSFGKADKGTVEFRVDRPFVMAIRHRNTGCVLFLGKVMNSSQVTNDAVRDSQTDSQTTKGIIKEVTDDGKRVRILVEEPEVKKLGKVFFDVPESTDIAYSDKQKARAADLKVGQRVTVHFSSGLDETKPPTGKADLVIIEVSAKPK